MLAQPTISLTLQLTDRCLVAPGTYNSQQITDYHNLLALHTYRQHGYADLSSIVYHIADHTTYASCPDPINTLRSLIYHVQPQQILKQNMHTVSHLYTGKQSVESRVIMMELDGKSRPPALHFQCYKVADLLSSLDLQ